jgi:hypothetical protein
MYNNVNKDTAPAVLLLFRGQKRRLTGLMLRITFYFKSPGTDQGNKVKYRRMMKQHWKTFIRLDPF